MTKDTSLFVLICWRLVADPPRSELTVFKSPDATLVYCNELMRSAFEIVCVQGLLSKPQSPFGGQWALESFSFMEEKGSR